MVNRLGICASLRGLANKFKEISEIRIIFLVSLFVGLFGNWTFFSQVFLAYPFSLKLVGFYLSLLLILVGLTAFLITLVASKYTTKGVLIFTLILTAFCAYFMDSYQVVIDETMLVNTFETNAGEAGDLISLKLIGYVVLLGLLPSFFVWKAKIQYGGVGRFIFNKTVVVGGCLLGYAFFPAYVYYGFIGPFSITQDADLLFCGVSFCFHYLGPF